MDRKEKADLRPECPEITMCACPVVERDKSRGGERCRKIDTDRTVLMLERLVSDPVTRDDSSRICRLLYDYLHEIGDEGYRVKHLPSVMRVLEFLAWRAREIEDYRIHLERMLALCVRPPLLDRASETLVSFDVMQQYFTTLGYLLVILPTKSQVRTVREALRCLLIETKPGNVAATKLDFRRRAMEKSRLPTTVAELLDASHPDMYEPMLDLAFLLISVSLDCCYRMLEAGVLNTLLTRMDLAYATQAWCAPPPTVPFEGDSYSDDTTVLITNVLWGLMRSVVPPNKLPASLDNLPSPVQCAMWGLRYAFKREIRSSQGRLTSVKIRNEMAMLILVGLVALPSWNLISSGIADDIVSLLVETEAGTATVWMEKIKLSNTVEDLFFRKVMLLIVSRLADIDACIFIMRKKTVVDTVLRLIDPNADEFDATRTATQFSYLSECAMYALCRLAPRMPTEFVKHNGTTRLISIVERSLESKLDAQLVMDCVKTICSIATRSDSSILDDLRTHDTTAFLIKLIDRILDSEKLTLQHQRTLTLSLVTAETLMKDHAPLAEAHGEQSINIVMKILNRYLRENSDEIILDQRLLLAVGSYIWECIVWCPVSLERFAKNGGMYTMLDVTEIATFPVRCLFLGVITDMCDGTFCGPYLCTWRGSDKKKGLMSLLATIWREEEIRIGVKRNPDGSVEDVELPQMGTKQWLDTYRSKLSWSCSPALVDMVGSARSKIYSIRKIVERDGERYEMARDHYKILLDDLSVEDRLTIWCVDLYFRLKIGQVWTEIGKYLEQVGVTPLSMDGQVMFLMTQRHRSWALFIEERQKRLSLSARDAEIVEEKEEYARIRDSKLAPALDALDEIDYVRRTSDEAYRTRMKDRQRRQVNAALRFPDDADARHCHRTFHDKINATATFGLQHLNKIEQASEVDDGRARLLPVTPAQSESLDDRVPSLTVSSSSLSCDHSLTRKKIKQRERK